MMIDTLSRGIDANTGRLRQMNTIKDRTVLFTAGSLDAGCDIDLPAFAQLGSALDDPSNDNAPAPSAA
ncbi:hypothetical protein I5U42_11090 [Stenotrophomonas maltophilia]|uniref:hypothetical protein n=1 Tax=Stenotrophomonas sp. RAC2 TaxID=3064902 RepID=UPI0018D45115|nr:hypothetical protein [Stenotrophomonas sp. RAC2]MBH1431840.1 hypothetical protein [Stenotrophomonas maltophilia]MDV9040431.1 hypothetical protein [Stenotrophomonas sp. RAC2]